MRDDHDGWYRDGNRERYSAHHSVWPYHYTVTLPGDQACDVRFFTATAGHSESLIARDGVVAVVNLQNSIARLGEDQVRAVLAGRIVDWSVLGGTQGAIEVALPGGDSDE